MTGQLAATGITGLPSSFCQRPVGQTVVAHAERFHDERASGTRQPGPWLVAVLQAYEPTRSGSVSPAVH